MGWLDSIKAIQVDLMKALGLSTFDDSQLNPDDFSASLAYMISTMVPADVYGGYWQPWIENIDIGNLGVDIVNAYYWKLVFENGDYGTAGLDVKAQNTILEWVTAYTDGFVQNVSNEVEEFKNDAAELYEQAKDLPEAIASNAALYVFGAAAALGIGYGIVKAVSPV